MIQLTDIQKILGNSLFEGAGDIAGLLIFGAAIYIIMMVTKDTMVMVVLLIPIMLILSIMGIISATVTFLMIIAMVIIIALNASRGIFGDA